MLKTFPACGTTYAGGFIVTCCVEGDDVGYGENLCLTIAVQTFSELDTKFVVCRWVY